VDCTDILYVPKVIVPILTFNVPKLDVPKKRVPKVYVPNLYRKRRTLFSEIRIVKGFDLMNREDFFELADGGGYALRGHQWKLKVKRSRLQLQKCFFSQRAVRVNTKKTAKDVFCRQKTTYHDERHV